MWYVYYLYSPSIDRYYLGKTNCISRRFDEHNRGSEKYTKRGIPWMLVGYIECIDSKEAARIERNLKRAKNKSYTRSFIEKNGTIVE